MGSKELTYHINIESDISDFQKDIKIMQNSLSKVNLKSGLKDSFNELFMDINDSIDKISKINAKGKLNPLDEKTMQKTMDLLNNSYSRLIKKINSQGLASSSLIKDQKAIEGLVKAQEKYKEQIQDTLEEEAKLKKEISTLQKKADKKVKAKEYVDDIEAQKKVIQEKEDLLTKAEEKHEKRKAKGFSNEKRLSTYKELQQAQDEYTKAQEKLVSLEAESQEYNKRSKGQLEDYRKLLIEISNKKKDLKNYQDTTVSTKKADILKTIIKDLKALESSKKISFSDYGIDLDKITDADQLKTSIEKIEQVLGVRMQDVINGLKLSSENTKNSLDNMRRGADVASDGLDKLLKKQNALDDAKRKILSFFSIDNAVMLFKRSLNSAKETIKELDATMTEAAVVTDFSVGDMWEKLPEYSAEANKLGASINDLYGATTLYYQQGLKTEEAMSVGIETMKMARIANMNAEEATKAMTAALRGFNMEVNELNAKRVNDVYSELAAITAADTSQIATAMSKTASIASAANMEFETTAALLAQIIETTQEAPETAGTAMKTIIARFTEVKKLANEGALSGKDGEGEEIVINKIDGALQQVGISLSDFLNGTKGIDDIFLELASKWDSLDLATQRYIATQAAGSRQQSRFLAMMSDYAHSMELVEAANNSVGASDVQFGKTLDSLESKVNKLRNAWDQFTMGLANSSAVKGAVDLATNLLTIINELTEAISFGSDGLKSFFNILAGAGGVYGGNKVLTKTLDKIGGLWGLGEAAENKRIEKSLREDLEKKKNKLEKANIKKEERKNQYNGNRFDMTKEFKAQKQAQIEYDEAEEALNTHIKFNSDSNKNVVEKTLEKIRESKQSKKETIDLDEISVGEGIKEKLENLKELKKELKGISLKKITIPFSILGKTAAITASTLLSIVGALTAIVAVVAVISLTIKHFSLAEELKKAEQTVENVNTALTKAKDTYNEFQASRNKYDALQTELAGLTKGTSEWRDKLSEANEETTSILQKYQFLNNSKYLNKDKNGLKTINKEGWDKYQQYLDQNRSLLSATSSFTTAKKQYLTTLNNKGEELRPKTLKVNWKFSKNSVLEYAQSDKETIRKDGTEKIVQAIKDSSKVLSEAYRDAVETAINGMDIATDRKESISKIISNSLTDKDLERYTGIENNSDFSRYENLTTQGNNYSNKALKRLMKDYNYLMEGTGNELEITDDERKDLRSLGESLTGVEWEGKDSDIDNRGPEGLADTIAASAEAIYTQVLAKTLNEAAEKSPEIANLLSDEVNYNNLDFSKLESQINQVGSLLSDQNIELEEGGLLNEIKDSLYQAELDILEKEYTSTVTLAKSFGINTSDKDVIKAGDKLGKAQKALDQAIIDNVKDLSSYYEAVAQAISEYQQQVNNYLDETGIANKFNGDKNLAVKYGNMLTNMRGEGTRASFAALIDGNDFNNSQIESIIRNFEDIDTSSLIEVHDKLIDIANDTENIGNIAAQTALKADSNLYTMTNEANELFSTLSQDQLKELGEDGEITAAEILNLSKNNEKVKKTLDNTGISASTLGRYFKMLDDGVISTMDTFGNFVKVLDKAQAAQNVISDSFGFIDSFEATRSEGDIGAWWKDSQEKVLDLIDKGAYSDSQLQDYMEAFYGEINWEKMVNEQGLKNALDNAQKDIESYGTNMYSLWTNFINSGKANGMASIGDNGQVNFDMSQIGSIDNLKKQIQEGTGFSDELVDAMIADAETFSEDFKKELNKLSIEDTIREWLESAYSINGKTYVTENQTKILADSLGINPDVFQEALGNNVEIITSMVDEKTGTLNELIQEKIANSFAHIVDDKNGLDSTNVINYLIDLGLNDSQIKSALPKLLDSITNKVQGSFDVGSDGVVKIVKDKSGKTIEEVSAAAIAAAIASAKDKRIENQQKILGLQQAEAIGQGTLIGVTEAFKQLAKNSKKISHELYGTHFWDTKKTRENKINEKGEIAVQDGSEAVYKSFDKLITGLSNGLTGLADEAGKGFSDSTVNNIVSKLGISSNDASSYTVPNAQTKNEDKNKKEGRQEYWDNPFDEFFNLTEKINEEMRTRERLEREYNRILEDETKTYKDLIDSQVKRTASLNRESDYQQSLAEGKLSQIQKAGKRSFADSEGNEKTFADWGVTNLARYDANEGRVIIDWQGLEALTRSTKDADKGKAAEEYIKLIQGFSDELEEAQDKRDEIRDELEKIRKENIQKYLDFENRVLEAVKQDAQNRIDNYKDLSDSLSKSTTNVLDSLQESIDLERQIRNNTEKEEDIASKERRLAYLRMDTSGASDLEILQLEEELERDREAYSDELVDQHLQDLSDENQKAAEQRQLQIDTMQAQLDYAVKSGQLWEKVHGLIDKAINGDGSLNNNSPLVELLKSTEGYAALSAFGKDDWGDNLAKTFAASMSGYAQKIVDDAADRGSPISLTNGGQATYNKSKGRWEGSGGYYSGGVTYDVNSGSFTGHGWTPNQSSTSSTTPSGSRPNPNGGSGGSSGGHSSGGGVTEATPYKDKLLKWANSISYGTLYHFRAEQPTRTKNGEPYTIKSGEYFKLKGKDHLYYWSEKDKQMYPINSDISESRAESLVNYHKTAIYASGTRYNGNGTYGATKLYPVIRDGMARAAWHVGGKDDFKYMKRPDMFKTGGLADYTGPAWLDGTKSHPELVLNAQDTENFIKLKDILGSIMSNSQPSGQSTGDNYYDIHINVDEIANDYDVDQMMNRLEKRIHDEATYRNVNAINFLR